MTERDPQTYQIIGAAIEVHRQLGAGFSEPVYQDALEIEFGERRIPFGREVLVPVLYKGRVLKTYYRPDFVCFDSIIVELKALDGISGLERSQVLNYLKVTSYQRGLLLNFGTESLTFERIVSGWKEMTGFPRQELDLHQ